MPSSPYFEELSNRTKNSKGRMGVEDLVDLQGWAHEHMLLTLGS